VGIDGNIGNRPRMKFLFLAPLHTYLTIVLGTLAIFLTGFVLSKIIK
jgi:hypothetical protein